MLWYDGQLRNGSVATHFILISTAMSSATGRYVVIPEWPSRKEEPTGGKEESTGRNEEQTRKAPRSYLVLPQKLCSELICILSVLEHEILSYLARLFFFHRN